MSTTLFEEKFSSNHKISQIKYPTKQGSAELDCKNLHPALHSRLGAREPSAPAKSKKEKNKSRFRTRARHYLTALGNKSKRQNDGASVGSASAGGPENNEKEGIRKDQEQRQNLEPHCEAA